MSKFKLGDNVSISNRSNLYNPQEIGLVGTVVWNNIATDEVVVVMNGFHHTFLEDDLDPINLDFDKEKLFGYDINDLIKVVKLLGGHLISPINLTSAIELYEQGTRAGVAQTLNSFNYHFTLLCEELSQDHPAVSEYIKKVFNDWASSHMEQLGK